MAPEVLVMKFKPLVFLANISVSQKKVRLKPQPTLVGPWHWFSFNVFLPKVVKSAIQHAGYGNRGADRFW